MYSKSTSEKLGVFNIPGNYSGNAFRAQGTAVAPSSPSIPGFYRQTQRSNAAASNSNTNHNVTNSHTSFSARDTNLAPKPSSEILSNEESEKMPEHDISMLDEIADIPEIHEASHDYNTDNISSQKEDCCNNEHRSLFGGKFMPESDDLLLLGLLILLMQNKGNEDLMMIIAMLLMTK